MAWCRAEIFALLALRDERRLEVEGVGISTLGCTLGSAAHSQIGTDSVERTANKRLLNSIFRCVSFRESGALLSNARTPIVNR